MGFAQLHERGLVCVKNMVLLCICDPWWLVGWGGEAVVGWGGGHLKS